MTTASKITVRKLRDGRHEASCSSPKLVVVASTEAAARELCRDLAAKGARLTSPAVPGIGQRH